MALLDNVVAFWKLNDAAPTDYSVGTPQFVDASFRGNTLSTYPDQRPAVSTVNFKMGTNNAGFQKLDGSLAGWGIWKRKLTGPEKAALAGGEMWPFSTTTSLADAAAYYLLDEASNSTTYVDATGRGNDLSQFGTTTQVTGPGGSGHACEFTPGAFLYRAPVTADLQGGNVDHTIVGWVKLNSKTASDQQIFWGQIDLASSPEKTGDVVYYEGTVGPGDTFNYDLGNGADLVGNCTIVYPGSPSIGTWYFLLSEYDATSSIQLLNQDNGTPATFAHNFYQGGVAGKISDCVHFQPPQAFGTGSSGWDDSAGTPQAPILRAPNNSDTVLGATSKTFWLWFKADSTSAAQLPIAGYYQATGGSLINWLMFLGSNLLYFYVGDAQTTGASVPAGPVSFTDTTSWHLLVGWYDAGAGTVNLDLDHGASTASASVGAITPRGPASDPIDFGGNSISSVSVFKFPGSLDAIGIANGVPISSDLDALWNGGSGVEPTFTPPTPTEIGPTPFSVAPAFHNPGVAVVYTIVPTHFSVTPTFHNPAVANIVSIRPTPFSVRPTFHPPRVGGTISASIRPTPFSVRPTFPAAVPTMTGGDTLMQVFISNVNITKYVSLEDGVNTLSIQGSARSTLTLQLTDKDGTWSAGPVQPTDPTLGLVQPVIVTEGGRRMFSGCLIDTKWQRPDSTDCIKYTITATDKAGRFDWRRVFNTYTAGTDVANAVRDIVLNNLDGEGISVAGVPMTLGEIDVDEVFNWDTVTTAFDRLAADAVALWWVDEYGVLYFRAIDSLPDAPFALQETPPGGSGTQNDWSKMTLQTNLTNYRNHQIVLSNLAISSAVVPTITETYTLPQPAAVARGFRFGVIVLNFNAAAIDSLTVNGVAQPVRNGVDLGLDFDKSWWAVLPSPYVYGPDPTLPMAPIGFPYYDPISPFPSPDDVVAITYTPTSNNSQTVVQDALAPTLPGLMRCGSGKFEAVEQISNITTPADMMAIAVSLLARAGTIPYFVNYTTWRPGLRVGQKQHINIPKSKIPSTDLVITSMQGTHTGRPVGPNGKVGDLGKGSAWMWVVQANSVSATAQVKVLEKIINRSTHPLPLVAYEEESLILMPGSSISTGIVSSNPTSARQSGVLVEVVVQCGVAPTDQTLVLDIINSRYGSILGPGNQIKIASGDFTQKIVTKFVGSPGATYMFRNDGLTVNASYIVTGPDPAAAGSVSVFVRWQVPSLPAGFVG